MSRPTKQGVDYFPLDVYLDDKFKFIEIKFKLEGFAIIIKLLQKIYGYGYWYKFGEDERLLFSSEINVDINVIESVINEATSRGIFNKKIYNKYEVLTSKGIQKRFCEIIKRRKDIEIVAEYKVIDDIFGINEIIKSINVDIMSTSCEHNVSKSTQTKVNKTKVNKTKVNKTKVNKYNSDELLIIDEIEKIVNIELRNSLKSFFDNRHNMKKPLTKNAYVLLIKKLNKYSDQVKIESLNESIINGWQSVFPKENNHYNKPKRENTAPDWMSTHQQNQPKQNNEEVDKKELQELLNSFKEENDE